MNSLTGIKWPSAWRWGEYLAAILAGNAVYFLCFLPHLPRSLRHEAFQLDWGLGLDFAVCVLAYGLIRLGLRVHSRSRERAERV